VKYTSNKCYSVMLKLRCWFFLYRANKQQSDTRWCWGPARKESKTWVQGVFRTSKKQRMTARYSVSDVSKLGATYSNNSSMEKFGMKPYAEVKNSTKICHEW